MKASHKKPSAVRRRLSINHSSLHFLEEHQVPKLQIGEGKRQLYKYINKKQNAYLALTLILPTFDIPIFQ